MLKLIPTPYLMLAAFFVVTSAYMLGSYNGYKRAVTAQALETARSAQDAKETNDTVRRLPDGAAAIELRKHW
jgi:hypothetical protein